MVYSVDLSGGGNMSTIKPEVKTGFVYPLSVVLCAGLLSWVIALNNNVEANTIHRISAEEKDKVLIEMRESLVRMEQDLKYLRKDVDELKVGQKELTVKLQEDRDRVLKPWKNVSKPE